MTTYVTIAGKMLDAICYRHYGSIYEGQVEAVLETNRELDLGQYVILPGGLKLILPDLAPETTEIVRLFS